MKLRIDAASSIGGRPSQDDCLLIGERPVESPPAHTVPPIFVDVDTGHPPLLAVLDGVSCCSCASLGSALAASTIQSSFYAEDWFSDGNNRSELVIQKLNNACLDAAAKLALWNQSFSGSI